MFGVLIKTRSLILFLISLATLGIGFILWSHFYYRKERRLFKNIRRNVYILGNQRHVLEFEARLLKKVEFFKVYLLPKDQRSLDLVSNKSATLIILGYEESDDFRQAFNECKLRKLPVIICSNSGEITKDDMVFIQKYAYHTLCNTPLRLISDVFNIMATWPKRKD